MPSARPMGESRPHPKSRGGQSVTSPRTTTLRAWPRQGWGWAGGSYLTGHRLEQGQGPAETTGAPTTSPQYTRVSTEANSDQSEAGVAPATRGRSPSPGWTSIPRPARVSRPHGARPFRHRRRISSGSGRESPALCESRRGAVGRSRHRLGPPGLPGGRRGCKGGTDVPCPWHRPSPSGGTS